MDYHSGIALLSYFGPSSSDSAIAADHWVGVRACASHYYSVIGSSVGEGWLFEWFWSLVFRFLRFFPLSCLCQFFSYISYLIRFSFLFFSFRSVGLHYLELMVLVASGRRESGIDTNGIVRLRKSSHSSERVSGA